MKKADYQKIMGCLLSAKQPKLAKALAGKRHDVYELFSVKVIYQGHVQNGVPAYAACKTRGGAYKKVLDFLIEHFPDIKVGEIKIDLKSIGQEVVA